MDTSDKSEVNMSMEGSWKDEFRVANFKLHYPNPEYFVLAQCGPTYLYPIWSICWLLFHISWVIYEIVESQDGGSWFIYLTNWGFILIVTTQVIDASITIYVHVKRKDIIQGTCHEMVWYFKCLWVLFNMANAIAMVVTLAYWTLLSHDTSARSVNKHALNFAFVILCACFSAKPIRVYHMYQPVIFAIVYVVFTGIYQGASGSAIYTVVDWSKPGSAIAICLPLAIVGVPLSHLFFFALYKLRCVISRLCCKSDPQKVVPLHKTESKEMFAHQMEIPRHVSTPSQVESSRNTPISITTPTPLIINSTLHTPEHSTLRHTPNLESTPEE